MHGPVAPIGKGTRIGIGKEGVVHEIWEVVGDDIAVTRCNIKVYGSEINHVNSIPEQFNCPKCIAEAAKLKGMTAAQLKLQLLFGKEKAEAIEKRFSEWYWTVHIT